MSKHVIEDAKRCLQCHSPMCSVGCPIRTPLRDAIRLLLDSKSRRQASSFLQQSPFHRLQPCVPPENQCEGHCVLGKKGTPVQISAIEQYISDYT
jgi:glutamate synthase (NADPH/NADH) small chain